MNKLSPVQLANYRNLVNLKEGGEFWYGGQRMTVHVRHDDGVWFGFIRNISMWASFVDLATAGASIEGTPLNIPKAALDPEGYFDSVYPDELKVGDVIPGWGTVASISFTAHLEEVVKFDTETPWVPTPLCPERRFSGERMATQLRVWRHG